MIKARITIALAMAATLAVVSAATAQTATPDTTKPPVKKSTLRRHAHKSTPPPAGDMYLRAAGSEPAPKASK